MSTLEVDYCGMKVVSCAKEGCPWPEGHWMVLAHGQALPTCWLKDCGMKPPAATLQEGPEVEGG